MKIWRYLVCSLACLCLSLAWTGAAWADSATPTPAPATVTITLLDTDGLPLIGTTMKLELVRYGDAVEYLPGGECKTDSSGRCTFVLADAPRTRSGYAEALLEVGQYGTVTLGWQGAQTDITLNVTDVGLEATLSVPLDKPYDGQTEQAPEEAPNFQITPTETPRPTQANTSIPPTLTSAPTETAIAQPTLTVTPSPTPTPEPDTLFYDVGIASIIFLALVMACLLLWLFAQAVIRRFRSK